jgi:3-oxoacyl-[acyl-carrier protein] reductase
MIDPGLTDRVVLITGANHGIGAATALAFAEQGAHVFITYYRAMTNVSEQELRQATADGVGGRLLYEARHQQSADAVVRSIRAAGGVVTAFEADLACAANIRVLFDLCEERLGPVDVLVNNHTACILETFDPARVTDKGFPVHLPTAESIDTHFVVNARATPY